MHIVVVVVVVASSWTECAKYSIERGKKKKWREFKGRNRVPCLDPEAREAVNAKYVYIVQSKRNFRLPPVAVYATITMVKGRGRGKREKRVFILRDRIKTYLPGQWAVILIT